MTELFLLARVAGEVIALPACGVEGVVDIVDVTPVPRTPPHVIGLAAVRSRIVTLIDVAIAVGETPLAPLGCAIIASVDGHRYALRVDTAEDALPLASASPIAEGQLRLGWRGAAIGRLQIGDRFALLLDVERIVSSYPAHILSDEG